MNFSSNSFLGLLLKFAHVIIVGMNVQYTNFFRFDKSTNTFYARVSDLGILLPPDEFVLVSEWTGRQLVAIKSNNEVNDHLYNLQGTRLKVVLEQDF